MKRLAAIAVVMLMAAGCASPGTGDAPKPAEAGTPAVAAEKPVLVRLVTTAGNIALELEGARAPLGVANFLAYAQRGDYGGTIFHRTVPGFVIQGGGSTLGLVELKGD